MQFYINDNVEKALHVTGLALDELEIIVGRFKSHSVRSGKLRGEVIQNEMGEIIIRHHFTKKVLWKQEEL